MFPNSNNPFTIPGQDPLEKERNQILQQTSNLIERQNKIISEQAEQVKTLSESAKKSAEEAKSSSQSSKQSAKISLIVSCIMGAISFATLIIEIIRLCLEIQIP